MVRSLSLSQAIHTLRRHGRAECDEGCDPWRLHLEAGIGVAFAPETEVLWVGNVVDFGATYDNARARRLAGLERDLLEWLVRRFGRAHANEPALVSLAEAEQKIRPRTFGHVDRFAFGFSPLEQLAHLLVGCLLEVVVPDAHAVKRLGSFQ